MIEQETNQSHLAAALEERVMISDGIIYVSASDLELESFGEAAIIAAHKSTDRVTVGRIFLSKLSAMMLPVHPAPAVSLVESSSN